jgi:hypothetical protein
MRRMRGRAVVAATLALAVSLGFAGSAPAAVTIGSNFSAGPTLTNLPCNAIPCTAITFDASPTLQASGGLHSPIDGVVTSWRIESGSAGNPVNLRILRPGTGLSFTAAGTSATQTTVSGLSGSFPTQLAIKVGDAIGVDTTNGALIYNDNAGATMAYWSPLLADGATLMGTAFASREVRIQANVEPDVDCDGKGDETQDSNLTDGPCKAPPVQTLTAKKKQKLAKAAVNETLNKAGTVSLQARVKVPGGSHPRTLRLLARVVKSKKSTTSLAANVKTKIKLKFSTGARKKIKAAIADSGPRKVTATSTATDTFGNVSTAKVKFKLTG